MVILNRLSHIVVSLPTTGDVVHCEIQFRITSSQIRSRSGCKMLIIAHNWSRGRWWQQWHLHLLLRLLKPAFSTLLLTVLFRCKNECYCFEIVSFSSYLYCCQVNFFLQTMTVTSDSTIKLSHANIYSSRRIRGLLKITQASSYSLLITRIEILNSTNMDTLQMHHFFFLQNVYDF